MKLELTFKFIVDVEDDLTLNDVLDMRSHLAITLERRADVRNVDVAAPIQFRSPEAPCPPR